MAGNTVEYELLFSDKSNSMQKRIDDAKTLNKEMTQAAKSSYRAEGNKGVSGQDYGRARGAAGTGASARDFAKESQGLGGLVRLYATVAANLFAVGAAFNTLREAMNTTNMVEGLNQLGATSGQSLGTLAKNLATASGGALSLRDAMEATAKATSAGMSSKQLMQLGSVARNASQALGLNMADAVSRLTRGITKLEPELLDELGIFTKIGPATEEYARSVGKSAGALTDFERRQAFANAVLKEGTDKFNAINIPTNPYDKLLASLKDLAQNGLEVVNKYLGPVLNSLSQSPGALTAGIAYLSAMLVKQALPAITEYREGLLASAKAAKEAADYRAAEAKKAQESQAVKVKQMAESAAEKEVAAADAAVKRIEELRSTSFGKQSKGYAILQKAAQDVSKEELDYLTKVGARYEKQGKLDIAGRYYEAARAISASKKAEEDYGRVVEETTRKLNQQQSLWTARGRAEMMAKRTADVAASKQILSQSSTDTSTLGIAGAFSEMKKSLKESDMGPIRKGFTAVRGAATIAMTAVTGFVGALQGVIGLAGAIAGIAVLIDSWFTKNAEQAKAFSDAVDTSNEMVKTYERTLAFLSKQKPEALFQSQGLLSQANALQGLVDGLTAVREKFQDLDKATTGWDRFTDKLASLIGRGQLGKFAEATVKNIVQTIAAIDSDIARETALKTVTAELGAAGDNQIQWLDAIKKGGPEAANKIQAIEEKLKKVANAQSNVASRSVEFDESLKKLNITYLDFTKSALDQSPLTKLGDDMAAASVKMVGALDDPVAGIASMKKLLEETAVLGVFNPALVQQINRLKPEIDSLNQKHGQTAIQLKTARQEVIALELEYQKLDKMYGGVDREMVIAQGGDTMGLDALEAATDKLNAKQAQIAALTKKDTEERAKIAELMNSPKFKELAVDAFITGSQLVSRALDEAFEKARIDLAKGILGMMGSIPGIARLESQLNQREYANQEAMLKLQESMLRAQHMQIAATTANTAALNLSSAREAFGNMDANDRRAGTGPNIAAAESEAALAQKFQSYVTGGKGAPSSKNFLDDLNNAMSTFGKDSPEAAARINTMRESVKAFMGTEAERSKLETGKKLDILKMETKIIEENNRLVEDNLKLQNIGIDSQLKQIEQIQQQNGKLTDEQITRRASLETQQAQAQYDQEINSITAQRQQFDLQILALKAAGVTKGVEELQNNYAILESTKVLGAFENKTNKDKATALKEEQEVRNNLFNARDRALQEEINKLETIKILQSDSMQVAELELQLAEKRNSYNPDELAAKKLGIELTKLQQEETGKLASLEANYRKSINKLSKDYLNTAKGGEGNARREEITAEMTAISERYVVEYEGIRKVTEAKKNLSLEDSQYSQRALAYGEVFEKAFQGMGDVMVNFAKTGKMAFGDLIGSMIEGLIRYEMQLQATAMYAAFRPGLMSAVTSIFGGGASTPTIPGANLDNFFNAKGNAFDYAIEPFAKGGMFTNSIVDSPTMFKFAKGTGLMGEAGPEAIMPLTRDGNGTLGVRAEGGGGGNVDVVVNNYGSEKATTKETTDSRGNRKIEVVIGDMTASEISRNGSASQKAIRGTFGLQPQLIRR
jgi:lambda family phage tail tape measure protein